MLIICFKGVKRPSLSKFNHDRVHRARFHVDRDFQSLVTLRRLAKWGLGPEPSDEAIAHEVTVRRSKFSFNGCLDILSYFLIYLWFISYCLLFLALGMSTMKENKEKEVVGEESRPKTQSQAHPSARDKRKPLPKNLDIGNLPSRRGKKAKHGSSQTAKPNLPPS